METGERCRDPGSARLDKCPTIPASSSSSSSSSSLFINLHWNNTSAQINLLPVEGLLLKASNAISSKTRLSTFGFRPAAPGLHVYIVPGTGCAAFTCAERPEIIAALHGF